MTQHVNPYQWEERHSQLNDALTALVPFTPNIISYARDAGLDLGRISWSPIAYNAWNSVISEAIWQSRLPNLIDAALDRFPGDPFLLTASKSENVVYALGPTLGKDIEWKGTDPALLEVFTQPGVNTLLQINFLQKGILSAKPVAKVQYRKDGKLRSGSGFLTDDNIFITNNHVIPDEDTAAIATLLFNYEDDLEEVMQKPEKFKVDPTRMITSKKYDTTAIRLTTDANQEYKALPLKAPQIPVAKGQFVNIIQHPAGMSKKIALYHNLVTTVEDHVVQYLTDTLKGSSGSPVFNSDWEVVALHHSGGLAMEEVTDTKDIAFQNEGINIRHVIELVEKGKKDNKL